MPARSTGWLWSPGSEVLLDFPVGHSTVSVMPWGGSLGFFRILQPLILVLVIWYIIAAVGLLRLRGWARTHALILSGIGLLFFPAGTILSIPALAYMLRGDVARLFELGEGPANLSESEARRMDRVMGPAKKG